MINTSSYPKYSSNDLYANVFKKFFFKINNVLISAALTYFLLSLYGSFRGAGPGCNTEELGEKLTQLKREISKLEDYEHMLDLHKNWVQQSITNIIDDIDSSKYLYCTDSDVYQAFGQTQILPIKAPVGSELVIFTEVSKIIQ